MNRISEFFPEFIVSVTTDRVSLQGNLTIPKKLKVLYYLPMAVVVVVIVPVIAMLPKYYKQQD